MNLHLSPPLAALSRMSLHLSPPCLPHLSLALGALGRVSLQLSPTCRPLVPPLSPTLVSYSGCLGLHDYSCLPLVSHSGFLGPHEFTLVPPLSPTLGALGHMSLHLSPPCLPLWVPWTAWVYTCLPLVSHSGCLGPDEFTLVSHTCLPHLSPTLGSLGRMSLHLSPTCLPLGSLGRMNLRLSPPCLPLWVTWAA